ncbi:MAG: hypothetical protein HYX75_07730 [Acidobacteria bacterium]|nr:hypothetical protein [Acidobacteriota bacterium]
MPATTRRCDLERPAGRGGRLAGRLPVDLKITLEGERCGLFVFDMKEVSRMPSIAEPFFLGLDARVEYCPAMNPEDLKRGLGALRA